MTSRERMTLVLSHKEADRVPILDGPWGTTVQRWKREGLPEDQSPASYFGYDTIAGIGGDTSFRLPGETLEQTEEYTITRNSNGVVHRNWKHATSTPELIDFLIKDRKSWEEHKHRFVYDDTRVNFDNAMQTFKNAREAGHFIQFGCALGYDFWQNVVGPENLLPAMIEDPEWVKELYIAQVELIINMASALMARGIEFDGASFADDLGYRNGTFFSPKIYREQLFPAHKRLCDFLNEPGIFVTLHSCGGVRALVPYFVEAGFACLNPLEVKSGMDVIELKREFGDKLTLMGGIDVRKMAADDPAEIEEEIRTKISVAKVGGGYIYHSDHSVPDNVSFQQYKRVMELVREYGTY